MKNIITLLLVVIYTSNFSQNPNHFIIGQEEFSNTDVYSIFQDSNDVLYVGTDKGLFIYKQNKFSSLEHPKQISNSFFDLKQNHKGTLFCKNLNGQIFTIQNDTLSLYYQIEKPLLGQHFNYFFDKQDRLIIVSKNIQRVTENKTEILFHKDSLIKLNNNVLNHIKSNQTSKGEIFVYLNNNSYNLLYKEGKLYKKAPIYNESNAEIHFNYLANEPFESSEREYFKFENKKIKIDLQFENGIKFLSLHPNAILKLNRNQGASVFSIENEQLIEKQTLFKNQFLSTAFKNSKGTLFLGTFGEGIIVIPKLNVTAHNYNYNFNTICAKSDKEVYLGTQFGELLLYNDSLSLIEKNKLKIENIIHFPKNVKLGRSKIKEAYYRSDNSNFEIKKGCIIDENNILAISYTGLQLFYNKPYDIKFLKKNKSTNSENEKYTVSLYSGRCYGLAFNFMDSTYYITTPTHLLYRKYNSKIMDTLRYNNNPIYGNDLQFYKDTLICGTNNEGILFFKNNKSLLKLNDKNGLKTNKIIKLLVKNKVLYILTNKGMQAWDLTQNMFLNTGINNGFLDGKSIKDFEVTENKIWVMTKNSFYSIDIATLFKEQKAGKLFFDSLTVNGNLSFIDQKSEYNYNQNQFKFYFDYRNQETKEEAKIQYILKGLHTTWKSISTNENIIEFESLPIGTYTLMAKATLNNKTSNVFSYSFTINAPIWQRWWFYLLLILLGGSVIYFIAKSRIRQITQKNKEKFEKEELSKDLAQSKLIALRTQINPHFIFNSLNAIQDLVLQKNTEKSYDYIVLFGQLVRDTLNYSEKTFIPIRKELEFLNIYLTLEKLRFGEELTYTINYTNNQEINIPPLIIQPFIENSLLHGLLHKEGMKKITINFILGNELICEIIDNGVGRKKANEIKQTKQNAHESFSTGAIKKRMQILSKQYNMDVNFNYEDLYENKIAVGTKVILSIPFQKIEI